MKKESLEIIYEKYSNEVYLYAFSLCKDYYIAEDLVSDTFFKALIALNDENLEIKYWLFRVCKNLWLDSLKRKKHFINSNIDLYNLSTDDTPLKKIIENENKRNLYISILNLPPINMEIVFLFYFCNIPLKEIALNLNITPGYARTLLCRTRYKLKKLLEEASP